MAYTEEEKAAAEAMGLPPYVSSMTGEVFYGGEQPPELTDEDEAILDMVWAEIWHAEARAKQRKNRKLFLRRVRNRHAFVATWSALRYK